MELSALLMVEKVIAQEIRVGIGAGKPYKAIYAGLKEKLSALCPVLAPQRPQERP